jgi:hypothetical protein
VPKPLGKHHSSSITVPEALYLIRIQSTDLTYSANALVIMPSSAVQNPPAPAESKSAKKKKAKAERTDSPAPTSSPAPEKATSTAGADNAEDSLESPYIRELQKYAPPQLL